LALSAEWLLSVWCWSTAVAAAPSNMILGSSAIAWLRGLKCLMFMLMRECPQ